MTAPGLEPWTARELTGLGLAPTEIEPGGVGFAAGLEGLARANLWLRTASRILLRLGGFRVRALGELERKARDLPWADWLPAGVPVRLRVTSRKSRLYHQKAISERLGHAIAAAGGALAGGTDEDSADGGDGGADPAQLLVVRLFRDELTLSLDSSGELLHRRGYRLATARAPLRETLAAALLLAAEWRGDTPLVDPFCGAGTIPIEAALLARRIPPGRRRRFALERWPGWRPEWLAELRASAEAGVLERAPAPILGSDRDAGAIAAAVANAGRAGVAGDIGFRQAALSALAVPPGPGMLVSNPPYGVRVGDRRELRDLYARLGQVARRALAGWGLVLLCPRAPLEHDTGLAWEERFRTENGGLPVRALACGIPA